MWDVHAVCVWCMGVLWVCRVCVCVLGGVHAMCVFVWGVCALCCVCVVFFVWGGVHAVGGMCSRVCVGCVCVYVCVCVCVGGVHAVFVCGCVCV